MATTSIWKVEGQLKKLLAYAMNPKKTEKQLFATGINCTPQNSHEVMNATKKFYGKEGGIIAFHGYQSFAPGEATPEQAHEIGVKLASGLWGERFEIIVTTHLDKGHLHNHIVINSVAVKDGIRFHRSNKTYNDMRRASDRLCKEYGLSVIKDPKPGKSKHYGEWNAEREGRPTWRSLIKTDVDEAIEKAATDKQFFQNLQAIGYEIKLGKDISVRPPGKERFLRLARNFGDEYTREGINRRILANRVPRLPITKQRPDVKGVKKSPPLLRGNLIGLYRHYKYLFGRYSRGSPANVRMHFLLREDIRHFDAITAEMKLLEREGIQTVSQLLAFEDTNSTQIQTLVGERKVLRTRLRRGDRNSDPLASARIDEINNELKRMRKEVRQCQSIKDRSVSIEEKITRIEAEQTPDKTEKEVKVGSIKPSSRTARPHDAIRQ